MTNILIYVDAVFSPLQYSNGKIKYKMLTRDNQKYLLICNYVYFDNYMTMLLLLCFL